MIIILCFFFLMLKGREGVRENKCVYIEHCRLSKFFKVLSL